MQSIFISKLKGPPGATGAAGLAGKTGDIGEVGDDGFVGPRGLSGRDVSSLIIEGTTDY